MANGGVNLSNWTVKAGKLTRDIPEETLDSIIEKLTNRIIRITTKIQELRDTRTAVQARLDRANQLKGELNP